MSRNSLDILIQSARADLPSEHEKNAVRAGVWSAVASRVPAPVPSRIPALRLIVTGVIASTAIVGTWLAMRDAPVTTTTLPKSPRPIAASEIAPVVAIEPTPIAHEPMIETPVAARSRPRPQPPAASEPADEGALLLSARRARADDPDGALRILDEHRTRYPDGALAQEREVMAIELLGRSERDRARDRASAFLARWPESTYRERIEQAVRP
jgi:hypothetical protein